MSGHEAGIAVAISLCAALLSGGAAAQGVTRESCGTAWTGWVNEANPSKNPCPKSCVRGERLKARTYGQGAKTQYDVQYQCYSGEALETGYPLIKGSPADPGAQQGAWIGWDEMFGGPDGSPVDDSWKPALLALARIVRESPALKDLGGFYPQMLVSVDASARPVTSAELRVDPWGPRAVEPDPRAKAGERRFRVKPDDVMNGPGGFSLYVNWLPNGPHGRADGLDKHEWMRDAEGEFFLLPPSKRQIAGFPVIAGYLFVTAAGKAPLFVAVSQERAYRAAIEWARKQVGEAGAAQDANNEVLANFNSPEMKKIRHQVIEEAAAKYKDPAKAAAARRKAEADDREQERQIRQIAGRQASSSPLAKAARETIARLEAELGALSAAERRAPAHVKLVPGAFFDREFVAAGAPEAVPLMQYNKRFFDAGQRDAPQLLVMSVDSREDFPEPAKQGLVKRVEIAITEQTDWRKAAALLK